MLNFYSNVVSCYAEETRVPSSSRSDVKIITYVKMCYKFKQSLHILYVLVGYTFSYVHTYEMMNSNDIPSIPFVKMHGTGNDFVIIDCRTETYPNIDVVGIANRRRGIGCDQTILLYHSDIATCRIEIYNPDGSKAEMCGNAVRCVIWLITSEKQKNATIELANQRITDGERLPDGQIKVNMKRPTYNWQDIPLSEPQDTLKLNLQIGPLKFPTATNMGNPHVTFFVDNVDDIRFEELAPLIENHSMFPDRINVAIATVINDDEIKVRIWERGAGITESCGSAACATLIAAIRKGLIKSNKAVIKLPGGDLNIEFDGVNVFMTGEAVFVFRGSLFP